ncbi:MAG: hypothetical protein AB8F74_04570, partial [Saprospiraceae bacterium]
SKSVNTDFLETKLVDQFTLNNNITLIEKGSLFRIVNKLQMFKWDMVRDRGDIKNFETIYDRPINPFYTILCTADSALQISLMPQPGFLELDLDMNMLDTFSVKGLNVRRIFKDRSGNYWIATVGDGMYFATAASKNAKNVIPSDVGRISQLTGDENGTIYISTESDGVYSLRDDKIEQIIPYDKIGAYVNGLAVSKEGRLFAAGDKGIFNFENNPPFLKQEIQELFSSNYDWVNSNFVHGARFNFPNVKAIALDDNLGNKRLWSANDFFVQYL